MESDFLKEAALALEEHVRRCRACQNVSPPVSDSEAQEAADLIEKESE